MAALHNTAMALILPELMEYYLIGDSYLLDAEYYILDEEYNLLDEE